MARPSRLPAASWALFDVANSAFPLVMTTAVFVIYFKSVIVGGDDPGRSDFLWGLSISLSAAIVALSSPFIGSVADIYGARKRLLFGYTLVAVLSTIALSFSGAGMIAYAMVFFILANAGFEGGMVMYGSLLPSVATSENTGRLSGIGWAGGYIGGLVCLLATMGWATSGEVPKVILAVAVWFSVLSIPLFAFVPEPAPDPHATKRPLRELKNTLWMVWRNPGLRLFFLAYFIYNDAIITVFSFAAPFATDVLHFSFKEVILLVAGVQVTGAIGAFLFGFLSDKIGHIRTISITLMLWVGVSSGAFATALELPIWQQNAEAHAVEIAAGSGAENETAVAAQETQEGATGAALPATATTEAPPKKSPLRSNIFWVLGLLVGFSMGATQSSSRAFLATITPNEISGRLFGLYAIAGRFSAVIGPFLFGVISFATGSKAWSVLALVVLFSVGLALVRRVNETQVAEELKAAASAANAG